MFKKILTAITSAATLFALSVTSFASEASTVDPSSVADTTPTQQFMSIISLVGPIVLIGVAFYFFLIRPQRKQEKEVQKMRSGIEVGDQITTIGGITGVVRQIKDDDTYIIETGADKSKLAVKKWAIQSKDTISDEKA